MLPCATCCGEGAHFCTGCRTVAYCSKAHQKHDWQRHRPYCQIFRQPTTSVETRKLSCVLVDESVATSAVMDVRLDWHGWEDCPVPRLLGFPLKVKSRIRPLTHSPKIIGTNQIAVFFMIDPTTCFAPYEWQLGPHMDRGVVAFAREDGKEITPDDIYDIHSYIWGPILDTKQVDPQGYTELMNPRSFQEWKQRSMGGSYDDA